LRFCSLLCLARKNGSHPVFLTGFRKIDKLYLYKIIMTKVAYVESTPWFIAFAVRFFFVACVENSYLNIGMCNFESSQKDETRAQSVEPNVACSKLGASNCSRLFLLTATRIAPQLSSPTLQPFPLQNVRLQPLPEQVQPPPGPEGAHGLRLAQAHLWYMRRDLHL